MNKAILESYLKNLKRAIESGKQLQVPRLDRKVDAVFLIGIGDSRVPAEVIKVGLRNTATIPIHVIKGEALSINFTAQSLIIAYASELYPVDIQKIIGAAVEKSAMIVGISASDDFIKWLLSNRLGVISLPRFNESEIVYPIVHILYLLYFYGFVAQATISQLDDALKVIDQREYFIQQGAENLALGLIHKPPVGLATEKLTAVLYHFQRRFEQLHSRTHTIVLTDEIKESLEADAFRETLILVFYSTLNSEEEEEALHHCSRQIEQFSDGAADIYLRYGDSLFVQQLYAILLIDWTAYYLENSKEIALQ